MGSRVFSEDVVARWRSEVEILRRRGAVDIATAVESCADELEAAEKQWELESLSLTDAAAETGKSAGQLRRDVKSGKLATVSDGPMKVRRVDVLRLHQGGGT